MRGSRDLQLVYIYFRPQQNVATQAKKCTRMRFSSRQLMNKIGSLFFQLDSLSLNAPILFSDEFDSLCVAISVDIHAKSSHHNTKYVNCICFIRKCLRCENNPAN